MVKFRRALPEEWEQLPPPQAKKAQDEWDEVLNALEQGEIVELETANDKDLRGKRIGISRRARGRQFTVEYRTKDNLLYAKRGTAPVTMKAKTTPAAAAASGSGARRRGRPRKDATAAITGGIAATGEA